MFVDEQLLTEMPLCLLGELLNYWTLSRHSNALHLRESALQSVQYLLKVPSFKELASLDEHYCGGLAQELHAFTSNHTIAIVCCFFELCSVLTPPCGLEVVQAVYTFIQFTRYTEHFAFARKKRVDSRWRW